MVWSKGRGLGKCGGWPRDHFCLEWTCFTCKHVSRFTVRLSSAYAPLGLGVRDPNFGLSDHLTLPDVYYEEGLILGGCKSGLSLTLVWLEVVWKDKPNLILTQIKRGWLTSEG